MFINYNFDKKLKNAYEWLFMLNVRNKIGVNVLTLNGIRFFY